MMDRICIALTLLISILLMGVLGETVSAVSLQEVEEQRLQAITLELRARLETDLRAGLALADNEDAQAMLESAAAQTLILESVEIDSEDGKVLFSSDRALRGQAVPPSWRQAANTAPADWRVSSRGEHTLGTALRDASGQIAGYLVSTHQAALHEETERLPLPVLWIAVAAGLLYLLAGSLLEGCASDLAPADDGTQRDAVMVIENARSEIERVDQEAHRIAGLKP